MQINSTPARRSARGVAKGGHTTKSPTNINSTGEAAAANKNREIRARLQIIGALQTLGIPQSQWPDFVRTFHTDPQARTEFEHSAIPPPFQPPDFDRLHESLQDWIKKSNAAWRQYQARFKEAEQAWITQGVDEEIPLAKSTRGTGRMGRNAALDLRYQWAARRLSGAAWKEIPCGSFKMDQVKKAATAVLKLADWPTTLKARKSPKSRAPL